MDRSVCKEFIGPAEKNTHTQVELASMERCEFGLPEFTTDIKLIMKVFNDRKEDIAHDARKLFSRCYQANAYTEKTIFWLELKL